MRKFIGVIALVALAGCRGGPPELDTFRRQVGVQMGVLSPDQLDTKVRLTKEADSCYGENNLGAELRRQACDSANRYNGPCYGGVDLSAQQRQAACQDAIEAKKQERVKAASERQAQQERQAQEEARDRLRRAEDVKQAAITQANASPRLLGYERIMTPLRRDVYIADIVSICRLRSANWHRTFGESIPIFGSTERQRLGLSAEEKIAADLDGERAVAIAAKEYPMDENLWKETCPKLANSQTLDRLDALQWKLSGGYH